MVADAVHQLAIETTGRTASLAVLCGDVAVRSYHLDDRTRTAATLAPAIKVALGDCERFGWPLSLISVAAGPGSFTGLRIGVTSAKTLAYAKKLPLVGVDSVAAVAAAVFTEFDDIHRVSVALDAYRGQIFAARFDRSELLPSLDELAACGQDGRWSAYPEDVRVLEGEAVEAFLTASDDRSPFAGDWKALDGRVAANDCVERQGLSDHGPTGVDAVGVGRLAIRSYLLGRAVSPMELLPRYLRPSAAEEKAALSG